jgi:hypothetical protein
MAYMRALAGASAATRARMNFLDLKAGDRRSVCHRTTATILPRAVLLALRQMKASTGRIPDYQPSGTSV